MTAAPGDRALVPAGGAARGDVLPGLPRSDGADRLAALTATWLARQRSPHTRTAYRRDLLDWLGWCAGRGLDPLAARMSDVDDWIVEQRLRGTRRGRPAAEATIARRVSTVSSWYGYLSRNSADDLVPLVTRNPAGTDGRPRLDPDHSPTVGLTRAELARLVAAAEADGPDTAALIGLLVLNGLRVGSAIAARVEDLGHDRGHRTLEITAKRDRRRRAVLPPLLDHAVATMLAARGEPTEGPLFRTPSGRPIYAMYVYRLVRRLARRAGIAAAARISPHSLRHTAITELLDASGGDLRKAQDFADHADPRTTRRYDRARGSLDAHGSYLLAARLAERGPG